MRSDLIVLGGGAAGMMAAGRAAELGCSVCLVEKNDRLGRKLRITGKGRCNVTNHCTAREGGGGRTLQRPFSVRRALRVSAGRDDALF